LVLSTHYLEEAEKLADRVVVLDRGRVVAEGSPAELMRGNGASAVHFSTAPGLDVDALSADLPAGVRVVETAAGRYAVDGVADPALLAAITSWCARREVLITDISVSRRSLEDVFLDLTGREITA
jgi:ABC-2 type transport system ATP-binding protein